MICADERSLFEYLKERYIPDLEPTGQFDYTDAFSRRYNMNLELKARRTHYPELLIEKFKYDKLVWLPNPRYVNSTPAGVFSFNLWKVPIPEWVQHTMPRSTCFESQERIIKLVGYLPIGLATRL